MQVFISAFRVNTLLYVTLSTIIGSQEDFIDSNIAVKDINQAESVVLNLEEPGVGRLLGELSGKEESGAKEVLAANVARSGKFVTMLLGAVLVAASSAISSMQAKYAAQLVSIM